MQEGPGQEPQHFQGVFDYTEVLRERNKHEKPHLTFSTRVGGEENELQRMMQNALSKFPSN